MSSADQPGTILSFEERTPDLGDGVFVAPGATVVGRVALASDVSIWYGAVLRGDEEEISIGASSNIQDNCVCHVDEGFPLTVGARVTVGHGVTLHGCTIGDDALIGMGAVVMNGATIGAGSLVAAGAVVPPGADVPPGSLVAGVPAKVRRDVTADEQAMIAEGPPGYVERAARHRRALAEQGQ